MYWYRPAEGMIRYSADESAAALRALPGDAMVSFTDTYDESFIPVSSLVSPVAVPAYNWRTDFSFDPASDASLTDPVTTFTLAQSQRASDRLGGAGAHWVWDAYPDSYGEIHPQWKIETLGQFVYPDSLWKGLGQTALTFAALVVGGEVLLAVAPELAAGAGSVEAYTAADALAADALVAGAAAPVVEAVALADVAVAAGGVGAATIPAAAEVAIAGGTVAAAAPSAFTLAGIGQALGQSAVGAAIKNLVAPSPAKLAPITAVAAAEAPAPASPLGMLALLGVLAFVIS